MVKSVLITGGAGFIGRAVSRALLAAGSRVRVLDSLIEQVHSGQAKPADLSDDVDFQFGDIRDADAVRRALDGIDAVIHLAAEVGVGQSMYDIRRYTSVNELGTAVLLEEITRQPVRRIVTASSMSIYGEGRYVGASGQVHDVLSRDPALLRGKQWDPLDAEGLPLTPVPTPENKHAALASVYAIGKYVQERMPLTVAAAYGMEAVALRLWNVFGPGQALSNPYTGVLAIFASRIANRRSPLVFEDGGQLRDFVHVDDVARAFLLALETPAAAGGVFNIASGTHRTIMDVGHDLGRAMGSSIQPTITQEGRSGDIRHCIADITLAKHVLGFAPREDFHNRLSDLAQWVVGQDPQDGADAAASQLKARGLMA